MKKLLVLTLLVSYNSIFSVEHREKKLGLSKVESVLKTENVTNSKMEINLTNLYELMSNLSEKEKLEVSKYFAKVNIKIKMLLQGFEKTISSKKINAFELQKMFTEFNEILNALFEEYNNIEIRDLVLKENIINTYSNICAKTILVQINNQISLNERLNKDLEKDLKNGHYVFQKHSSLKKYMRSKL